jgi:hypothetical protein
MHTSVTDPDPLSSSKNSSNCSSSSESSAMQPDGKKNKIKGIVDQFSLLDGK